MGYLTLNAIAITLLSALALWIFYRSAKIEKKRAGQENKKGEKPGQD
ncbi:hypothetical protein [Desulfovibrio sp.]|nr:hypothetical protein [Desulfovibrio sp.]